MRADRFGDVGPIGDVFDDLLGAAGWVAYLIIDGKKTLQHRTDAVAHRYNAPFGFRAIQSAFSKNDKFIDAPIYFFIRKRRIKF